MPVLFAPRDHIVVHNEVTSGLPFLASHVYAVCAQPLSSRVTEQIKAFGQLSVPLSMGVRDSRDSVEPGGSFGTSEPQTRPSGLHTDASNLDDQLCAIADTVLLVAAKVQQLQAQGSSDVRQRGVLPLLQFLVSACLVSTMNGVVVSDAAWIAMPKLPPSLAKFAHLAEKYSQIPLLVALQLQHETPDSELVEPVPEPARRGSSGTTSSATPSDLAEFLAKRRIVLPDVEYTFDDGPPAPQHERLHRIVFAAEQPVHTLTVLVVERRERIYRAMSSALFQRRSWGILTPVVGIAFSPGSSVVAVYVGWLEGAGSATVTGDGNLPRVHILHAPTPADACVAQGTFCLADPVHALSFARLLLSFQDSFEDDRRKSQLIEQIPDLRWRADQEACDESKPAEWTEQAIHQWCSGVKLPSTTTPPVLETRLEDERCGRPGVSSRTSVAVRDDVSSPFAGERTRTYSFEQYTALKETHDLKQAPIAFWLLDRYVAFHSLPPISAYPDPASYTQLDTRSVRPSVPFFVTYRTATRFRWPHHWTTMDCLPSVPTSLQGLENELFASYQSCRPEVRHLNPELFMHPDIIQVLERSLPTILQVCALAKSLNETSTSQHYRYCYDMIFGISASQNGVRSYPNASLRLSRSAFLDNMIKYSADQAGSHAKPMQYRQVQTLNVELHLFAGVNEELRALLKRAHYRFSMDAMYWDASMKDTLRRMRESPIVGTCDHFLALRLPAHLAGTQRPCPTILTGQSTDDDVPVPLLPFWSTSFTLYNNQRSYNILSTTHQDYPVIPEAQGVIENDRTEDKVSRPYVTDTVPRMDEPTTADSKLTVPLLVVVHGVQRIRFNMAESNRLRMCLTSSIQFLVELRVFDFPVFGLLTEGSVCAVIMGWASLIEGQTEVQLMELNCSAYDISAPVGAFNLTTFLLWLEYEHAPRLAEILKHPERLASVQRDASSQDRSGWAMEDQLRDLKLQYPTIRDQIKIDYKNEDTASDDSG